MKLLIILYAYGILKIVNPSATEPLYLLIDPSCKPKNGFIQVTVTNNIPQDDYRPEVVGYFKQGKLKCDIEQLVYPGI